MSETKPSAPRVHIHAPQPSMARLVRVHCPTCNRRTFSAAFFTEWYGWDETCLRCGDSWQDGEMAPRPFAPRWRKKSVEHAKVRYRRWLRRPTPTETMTK